MSLVMQSNAELSALFPAAAPEALETNSAGDPAPGGEAAGALLPPRRRRRWPWLVGAAVLAAAVGGVVRWRTVAKPPAPSVETARADRGRITVQVTASGTVSALKTVLVGSQVSGRVTELQADFNDPVEKGQLLARLDTQLFQSAVGQARASAAVARSSVTRAQAQLREAERQVARDRTLGDKQFLAQEVVDSGVAAADVARAALAGARAQAQQAAASLRQAELNLAMTAIYSPIDGVVISRSVDVGQTVAASLQAPTIFTLAEDLRKMQVEAHVAEGDVSKLAAGMPVSFTVDAFPGQKFRGTLRQVRNAATTVQSVVTYDAIVDVDNPDLKLRPGMTANVSFVVTDRPDVIRIPNAALRFRPTGAAAARLPRNPAAARDTRDVFALAPDGQGLRRISVRVGATDGSHTELVEGEVPAGLALVTDMGGSEAAGSGAARTPAMPGGAMGMPGMGGPGMGTGGGRRSGGRR
jgi:HlyD family secretion protein